MNLEQICAVTLYANRGMRIAAGTPDIADLWAGTSDEERESYRGAVAYALMYNPTPEQIHERWRETHRGHPNDRPRHELSSAEQAKDEVFLILVSMLFRV